MNHLEEFANFLSGEAKVEKSLLDHLASFQEPITELVNYFVPEINFRNEVVAFSGIFVAVIRLLANHPRLASRSSLIDPIIKSLSYLVGLGVAGPVFIYFLLFQALTKSKSLGLGVAFPSTLSLGLSILYPFFSAAPEKTGGLLSHCTWKNGFIGVSALSILLGLLVW